MKYINEVISYKPFNNQEKIDQDIILSCIEKYDDILSRDNKTVHMTSSSWIVNHDKTKILLVYHRIYDSWAWTGGHCDGDDNLLSVAIREAKEETGIINVKPVFKDIFSLESLCVHGHLKNGSYVSSHLHLNVTYLLEADENDKLTIKEDENKGVKWFTLEDSLIVPNEKWMVEYIYKKLNLKLKSQNYK